ncbi:beta-N-acetylglucosaminidase domain-containing protein [Micromonospora sp. NPDC050200]|uniref:beta-N-acetylglucosaminidase domain-containing protein n=1 Tax=Micromonospora sp. NPDC050200 TaxID=3155664 RepID=UPI0033D74B6F
MKRHSRLSRWLARTLGAGLTAALLAAPAPAAGVTPAVPLPQITPVPHQIARSGHDVVVPGRVELVTGQDTDGAARRLLVDLLTSHGADRVDVVTAPSGRAPLSIRLGPADRPDVAAALGATAVPEHAEGYALTVARADAPLGTVALGGTDAAGQYYAVQTLRQLFLPTDDGGWRIAGATVSDYPAMPLRGTIEGFYGAPWTHQERLNQLAFYGDVKANTYIYAPKDDPYHRARWREPYPAAKLAELSELVDQANAHHVRFTFALSPGNTICYSGTADRGALLAKFQAMYDIGVRAYSIPLDDIALRFNCAEDAARYGTATQASVGRAQAELLSYVQETFVETHGGTWALQTVPTQYGDLSETPYKQSWRTFLDPEVVVMWTGTAVVPPSITIAEAERISQLFGRKVFVWDNYPVNDYGNTRGRLLLAPYDKREAGLSDHLAGIVSNPMNQAAASKVAIFGFADFTWNDRAYDAARNWREAMRYLSGGDPAATEALLVFGDLNHLAPSFGAPWQSQAPVLDAAIDAFWAAWRGGDRSGAVAGLRAHVDRIAAAPADIRAGAVDPGFVSDASPWLDATELWGRSTQRMLDALQARVGGDEPASDAFTAQSQALMEQARTLVVDPPDNTWGRAPVRIADGVLDTFLFEAKLTLELWGIGDVENLALSGTATASSVEQNLDRLAPRFVNDGDNATRWASGYSDTEWVQVELAGPSVIGAVTVNWESACATAYRIQTSTDGVTWRTARDVTDSSCALDVVRLDDDTPVRFVRMQGVDRKTNWGYSIYELGMYGAAG